MTVIDDSTGYSDKTPKPPNKIIWSVRRLVQLYAGTSIVVQIMAHDRIVGLLFLDSEEDSEWVSERLSGTQKRQGTTS